MGGEGLLGGGTAEGVDCQRWDGPRWAGAWGWQQRRGLSASDGCRWRGVGGGGGAAGMRACVCVCVSVRGWVEVWLGVGRAADGRGGPAGGRNGRGG